MVIIALFVFVVGMAAMSIYMFNKAYEAAQDGIPVGYIGFTIFAVADLWIVFYGIKWDAVFNSFCNLLS